MQQQPPDRIGRAATIAHHLSETIVTRLGYILRKRRQQIAKQLDRQMKLSDHRTELLEQRKLRGLRPLDRTQFCAERRQSLEAQAGRVVAFVGEVVGLSCEGVDGA